uniref:Uncharacterized protein n=1 Tax=Amphimedon queenslandica TaxID=400682 RepID=A0A1X7TAE6_AMPQE
MYTELPVDPDGSKKSSSSSVDQDERKLLAGSYWLIPAEQGQTYASEVNAIFAETSALTARNVEEMFIEITRKLPPDCLTSLPAGASLLRQTDTPRAKGGCCGGGGGDKGPS